MKSFKFVHLYLIILILATVPEVYCQSTVEKGSNIISIGAGVGNSYRSGRTGPAFRFTYERACFKAGPGCITIGGIVGYSFHTYHKDFNGVYSYLCAGPRAAWHCGWNVQNLDTYAGIALGIRYDMFRPDNNDNGKPKFHPVNGYYGGFLGVAYYFGGKVGIFAEVGYDIALASAGLSLSF